MIREIIKGVVPGRLLHEVRRRVIKTPIDETKSRIAEFLPHDPVVVEAGAHNGYDTVQMANLWPKGRILAFEPVPHLYQRLMEETRYYSNVEAFNLALGSQTGKQSFNLSSGGNEASGSLLRPKKHLELYPDIRFDTTIEIDTIFLPDWCKGGGIDHIDFFWLDLQGYELFVLKSCQNLLRTTLAIYTEVNLLETYEGGATYNELRNYLEKLNFRVQEEQLEYEEGGNVLFVR